MVKPIVFPFYCGGKQLHLAFFSGNQTPSRGLSFACENDKMRIKLCLSYKKHPAETTQYICLNNIAPVLKLHLILLMLSPPPQKPRGQLPSPALHEAGRPHVPGHGGV
jgi:hypothetical protein